MIYRRQFSSYFFFSRRTERQSTYRQEHQAKIDVEDVQNNLAQHPQVFDRQHPQSHRPQQTQYEQQYQQQQQQRQYEEYQQQLFHQRQPHQQVPSFMQSRPQPQADEYYQQYLQQHMQHPQHPQHVPQYYDQQYTQPYQATQYDQFQPQQQEVVLLHQPNYQRPPPFMQKRPQHQIDEDYQQYLAEHMQHPQFAQQQPYDQRHPSPMHPHGHFVQPMPLQPHEQVPQFMQARTQQEANEQYQQYLKQVQQPHHPQPQLQPSQTPKFLQAKQHAQFAEQRTASEQETDAFDASDSSLQPWQRARAPSKVRSRSLQPRDRSLENLPWLRGKRDNSVPKQDTFIQGKAKEPVRPWIEEVIKLKRTELQQKVIERAKLEEVQLKESQIERHEIAKEELEKVDLKCIPHPIETPKFLHVNAHLDSQQGMVDQSDLTLQTLQEDQEIVREITQQIDNLIQKDASQAVPWEIQKQQLKTIERAQKIIDKLTTEEERCEQIRMRQEQLQYLMNLQRISNVEDSAVLTVDQQIEVQTGKVTSKTGHGKHTQMPQSMQPYQQTEDTTILSVDEDTQLETRRIDHHEQDVATQWQRGKKQKPTDRGILSHVEDTTVLTVKEREEITRRQLESNETPVGWRRGPKQRVGELGQTEIVVAEAEDQIQETPTQRIAERREEAQKAQLKATQHTEDVSILKVDERQEIIEQKVRDEEKPVGWKRGPKPKAGERSDIEEVTKLTIEEQEDIKVAGKPHPEEKAVPWMRGKRKSQPEEQKHPHEVQLKPAARKSIDKTKQPHEMTQVQLKSVPREQPQVEQVQPKPQQVDAIKPFEAQPIESEGPEKIAPQPAAKVKPQEEKPVEKVEQEEAQPWQRTPKEKPKAEEVEEKQWPTGKRRPKEPEQVETVELKPIPRKSIDEEKPKPKVDKKQPKMAEKRIEHADVGDDIAPIEQAPEMATVEEISESAVEITEEELKKAKPKAAVIKAPRFVRKLQPEVCKPDDTCVLQAQIDGFPMPEVRWMFNDVELHASQNYEMNVIEKVATLRIARVTPQDVGIYTCEIRNEAGAATSRANIVLGEFFILFFLCRFLHSSDASFDRKHMFISKEL